MDSAAELKVRQAAMAWLDDHSSATVDYQFLRTFAIDGEAIPLMDRQRGIRKPARLSAALSIRTTLAQPGKPPPYADEIGEDGLQRYMYRGTDPQHPENVALRNAYEAKLPLIWFIAVAKATYEAIYPVWIVGDEQKHLRFVLALDSAQRFMPQGPTADGDARAYAERITKARLHQPIFRSKVMLAYGHRCSICRLAHSELLDAAHIVADGKPNGQPVVPNGLALCKIHHGAYDAGMLGIRPDLTLHVRRDVRDEVDGWMLKGGIQGVHNKSLEIIPSAKADQPDPKRLEERYEEFLSA